MKIHRNKLVTRAGVLTASALVLLAVPTGTTEATFRKPPMPCVAIHARAFPVGSGFCPGTTSGLDWHDIARRLEAIAGSHGRTTSVDAA